MSQDGAFLFDQRRFWGDSRVRKMSGEQIALYLKLLSLQWENGDLPRCPDDLACEATEGRRVYTAESLTGDKDSLSPAKGSLMLGLEECFRPCAEDSTRMFNPYMHEVRETWRSIQKARSEGGRRGGKKSRKPKKTKDLKDNLKPTLSPPEAHPEAQRKPNVTKGREGKESKGNEESALHSCASEKRETVQAGFDRIWAAYPRKRGRKKALEKWKRMGKARPAVETVLDFIEAAKRSEDWTKDSGKFIPFGSTFFNQEQWQDGNGAFEPVPGSSKPGAQPEDEQQRLDRELEWTNEGPPA